jgi:hypothetical protein
MITKNKDNPQSPPTLKPSDLDQHLRERLKNLTAHVKQKSVDTSRLI